MNLQAVEIIAYSKPELVFLGSAEQLVRGSKASYGDNGSLTSRIFVPDCEFDD